MENNEIYTEQELEGLKRNSRLRSGILNILAPNGEVPDDTRKMRLLKEVVESDDASIHKGAENRARLGAAKSQQAIADTVAGMLMKISSDKNKLKHASIEEQIIIDVPEITLVAGETDIEYEQLELGQFIDEE